MFRYRKEAIKTEEHHNSIAMVVTKLSEILTWASYYFVNELSPSTQVTQEHAYQVNSALNEKVSLWQGDITKIAADAIVNAANTLLLDRGGVDGKIHAAAGKELFDECATLNECNVREAKITKGYNLPAKYIIHTAGTMQQDSVELVNSYRNSFALMLQHSLLIAFPGISTGIYGNDNENAAHIAIYEAREFLSKHHQNVDRVVVCAYGEQDLKIYEELLQRYFSVVGNPDADFSIKDIQEYIKNHPEDKEKLEALATSNNPKQISFGEILSKK